MEALSTERYKWLVTTSSQSKTLRVPPQEIWLKKPTALTGIRMAHKNHPGQQRRCAKISQNAVFHLADERVN